MKIQYQKLKNTHTSQTPTYYKEKLQGNSTKVQVIHLKIYLQVQIIKKPFATNRE